MFQYPVVIRLRAYPTDFLSFSSGGDFGNYPGWGEAPHKICSFNSRQNFGKYIKGRHLHPTKGFRRLKKNDPHKRRG